MRYTKAILTTGVMLIQAVLMMTAEAETVRCSIVHFVRASGTEMQSASISFSNADLTYAATIERLTIRNFFGNVIHDSGPAVSVSHPLNTDFASPVDITVVPAGAAYYIRTNHIWGNNSLPASAGGNEAGQGMSVTVQFSKEGKKDLLVVSAAPRSRERIITATGAVVEGAERSRRTSPCSEVPG